MKKRFRVLLLSAIMLFSFGFTCAQSKLGVFGIALWPDTAHCMVPYSGIRVYVQNMDTNNTFNGSVEIFIQDSSGSHLLDSGTMSMPPLGIDSLILNNYLFNVPEYIAGHDVVIVWPVALNGITISDSLRDSVYVICTSGMPDYKEKKGFSLFPDPANEMLYFKSGYNTNEIDYIRMIDIEGKELNRFSSSQTMIPVNDLERGMYFIEIKLKSGESITSKFVKD